MIINIVKHYSVYDPEMVDDIGYVTVECEGKVLATFDQRRSINLEMAESWCAGYVAGTKERPVIVGFINVADDEVDRP